MTITELALRSRVNLIYTTTDAEPNRATTRDKATAQSFRRLGASVDVEYPLDHEGKRICRAHGGGPRWAIRVA